LKPVLPLARLALPLVRRLVLLQVLLAPLVLLLVPLLVPLAPRLVLQLLVPVQLLLLAPPLPLLRAVASLLLPHWLACRLARWAPLARLLLLPLLQLPTTTTAPPRTTDRCAAVAPRHAAMD
jgi:hypothetical protein